MPLSMHFIILFAREVRYNFVQAKHELKAAGAELDDKCVRKELLQENCYWITFVMNVLSSSHKAGVREQQIQSIQNNLSPLLPSADKFCRKHWEHVQHLAKKFFDWLQQEYLPKSIFLQQCQKWRDMLIMLSLPKMIMPSIVAGNLHALSQLIKALVVVFI